VTTDLTKTQDQPEPQAGPVAATAATAATAETAAAPAAPAPGTEPAPDSVPDPAGSGKGRWIALGLVGVLVAVATGYGIGEAILANEKAPAAPVAVSAPVPTPPAIGVRPDGSHFGPLSALLLPVPATMSLGSDDPAFGNDTVLAAGQYQAFFNDDFADLSGSDRSRLGGLLDVSGLNGAALRTYMVSDQMEAEVGMFQMTRDRVVADSALQQELVNATGGFAGSVGVTGFPQAHCYLPPLQQGYRLDYMNCDAVIGDLLVTMHAYGVAPLDSTGAASLFQQQLARLGNSESQT